MYPFIIFSVTAVSHWRHHRAISVDVIDILLLVYFINKIAYVTYLSYRKSNSPAPERFTDEGQQK